MFSISKALGHSSTSVTSAVYMHLFDDAVADVVSQVASAITGRSRERQGNRNGSAGRASSSDSSDCKAFPLR